MSRYSSTHDLFHACPPRIIWEHSLFFRCQIRHVQRNLWKSKMYPLRNCNFAITEHSKKICPVANTSDSLPLLSVMAVRDCWPYLNEKSISLQVGFFFFSLPSPLFWWHNSQMLSAHISMYVTKLSAGCSKVAVWLSNMHSCLHSPCQNRRFCFF